MKIRIQNIYWMLAYAFQCLNEHDAKEYSSEEFDNVLNLFGKILVHGLRKQIKQGLTRDYKTSRETLSSPKGQLVIPDTIRALARHRKLTVCDVDEFDRDTYPNRIMKSVALLLVQHPSLDNNVRFELRRTMVFLNDIGTVDLRHITWNRLNYNRNNRSYRMLMAICRLIIDGMLINTDENKSLRLNEFIDDHRLFALYERFLLEFYRKHFPQFTVTHPQIAWDLDESNLSEAFLPVMQSDLMLGYKQKTLIIDAKFYEEPLNRRFGDSSPTLRSDHLYQIYSYVKNMDTDASGDVSGMLLYIKAGGQSPDIDYAIGKNRISAKTLDMDCPFQNVKAQLFSFAQEWIQYALPSEHCPQPIE